MLVFLLARLVATAIAFVVAAWVVPDVELTGGVLSVLWIAVLFGVVSAVLGPILRLLTLPLTVLTLGLFTLVVDGILVVVVAGLSSHLQVGGLLPAIAAALVLAVVGALVDLLLLPARGARVR